jgi:D-glycero-alpha-D-manno-heptose-7-phosphate kinase
MLITAIVPTRIDLAGGTLDVYPLYLFEGGGLTVNAAINVKARATIATRSDRRIVMRSEDLQFAEEAPSLEEMTFGGRLELVKRALSYYRPQMGLDITVRSDAPAGSGLGASSALLMALSHGLNELTGRGLSRAQIIDIGANIEAQVIGIPTGKQDYFPPIYGGVCAMWFDVDGWRFESLSQGNALIEGLNERLIVSYTGIPHSSSVTNWAMLKRYIEHEGDTDARIREIKEIALAMRDCLTHLDWAGFARLLDAEWKLRKGLAAGVTTPEVNAIIAAAEAAGAKASKICGAGGGGCMITAAEPEDVPAVRAALAAAGAQVMPARVVAGGIVLERAR